MRSLQVGYRFKPPSLHCIEKDLFTLNSVSNEDFE